MKIHLSATEAVAEATQMLRDNEDTRSTFHEVLNNRRVAAIAKLIQLAMPEATGQTLRDPQRRHR